jgi:hypothetical protein
MWPCFVIRAVCVALYGPSQYTEKRWKASKCGHSTFEEQSAEKRRKYRPTKAPANERRIAGHE